ncbi:hypothetical protein AMJ80_05905 [bacterium SM23_31]|nr:MAG: hypothetical protein AMJ80_05905 [bacterium SM23_31]
MESFQQKYGSWALVTGASSGIGAEFCRQLAPKGINLVMVARRKERMEQLAGELKDKHGVQTKVIPADLSKDDFMETLLPEISSLEIGLLINNAGFGIRGAFLNSNLERELEMLSVNCRAPLILTRIIGQQMLKRKRGGIIFIASVLGFIETPYFANYAASKAYNLYMGQALWYELKHHGIDVSVLSPGTTKTEFSKISGGNGMPAMKVEPVVRIALKKLGNKPSIVAGLHNRMFVLWCKLFPRRIMTVLIGSVMKKMIKN